MATLRSQVEELTRLKHRLAVWEAIHYLVDEKFISKDGRRASAIKVPNCAEEIVPEEVIDAVLQAISDGPIAELQGQIEDIENREVVVVGEAVAKA